MSFGRPHASAQDVARTRELYRRLVERVGEPDAKTLSLEALSAGEQALYVLITAADEVTAGGFEGFFSFAPELAARAPDSAALVKARSFQSLFERANAVAFDEPPRKRRSNEFRRMIRAVETGGDRLARLDDEFDALMADRDARVEAHLVRYIDSMPHEFADLQT